MRNSHRSTAQPLIVDRPLFTLMHFKNSKCWCWKILKFKYIMQKAICQNHVFSCFMIFLKEKKASVKMHFSYHFCKIFVNKKIVNKCDDCCCELFYLNADDREKMHFCLRYFVTTYKHAIWCTFCVLNLYKVLSNPPKSAICTVCLWGKHANTYLKAYFFRFLEHYVLPKNCRKTCKGLSIKDVTSILRFLTPPSPLVT